MELRRRRAYVPDGPGRQLGLHEGSWGLFGPPLLRKVLKSRCFCEVERRKVRDLDADRRGRLERKACFQKKCRTVVVPVAEDVVRRDRATVEGGAHFRSRRPRSTVICDTSTSSRNY